MDLLSQAEKLLNSQDFTDIQRGLGLAILAQVKEIKKGNNNTLKARKPEPSDAMDLYCRNCKKETQCVLGVQVFELRTGKGNPGGALNVVKTLEALRPTKELLDSTRVALFILPLKWF